MRLSKIVLIVLAVASVTFVNLPTVYGGLVFENEIETQTIQQPAVTRITPQAQATGELVEPSEEKVATDDVQLTVNLSKAEMIRRQRLRQELKNEDLVSQKLEELRLKDEMKRTDQILGKGPKQPTAAQIQASNAPLQTEVVGTADPNTMAAPANLGQAQAPSAQNTAMLNNTSVNTIPVSAVAKEEEAKSDSDLDDSLVGRVKLTPRGGISNISNNFYEVESRYSVGFDIGVDISDHFGFVGGYTFSAYDFGAGNSLYNPYAFNTQRLELNDNVINLGAKIYVLGKKSRVRPFIGAGAAYRRGYVNYDDRTLSMLRNFGPYYTQDVKLTAFMGYLESGIEFQITKAIALTGSFRYFNILSARQTNPVPANAFINPNSYGAYGYSGYYGGYAGGYGAYNYNSPYGYNQDAKSTAGDALARENFFQLMGGISVSF